MHFGLDTGTQAVKMPLMVMLQKTILPTSVHAEVLHGNAAASVACVCQCQACLEMSNAPYTVTDIVGGARQGQANRPDAEQAARCHSYSALIFAIHCHFNTFK